MGNRPQNKQIAENMINLYSHVSAIDLSAVWLIKTVNTVGRVLKIAEAIHLTGFQFLTGRTI